jgi:hypothetical protein
MNMANSSRRCQVGDKTADEPYLVLRVDHLFAPFEHPETCLAIGHVLSRPCFAPLDRMEFGPLKGRAIHRGPLVADRFPEFATDPRCALVTIDNRSNADAFAHIATGRLNERIRGTVVVPEVSGVMLPADPALLSARIDAFCVLAAELHAIVGSITMEPDWGMASTTESGVTPPPLAEALLMPGYTERRVRERAAYSDYNLPVERELWGPEWGLLLTAGHLERVPLARLRDSGVFARVEPLADGLVYVQLTDDPADALRDDYDDMLDAARAVLAPVLTDLSHVIID